MTAGPPPRPSTARLSEAPIAARRAMTRPRAVTVAHWLWWVGAALATLTVLRAVGRLDEVRGLLGAAVLDSDPDAAQDVVDRVVDASVLVIVIGGLLLGLVGGLLAPHLRSGRGWARLTLTLVAVLAVAYGVLVVSATGWLVLAYSGVAAVAAACAYLPGSARWFSLSG